MKTYKIFHETNYDYSSDVQLLPHTLRLRPREGHELRIESSSLEIFPKATLLWHRDVEGNSVASANFTNKCKKLTVRSEVKIQQYDQEPYNFLISDYAVDYPFRYNDEDKMLLSPYMTSIRDKEAKFLKDWVDSIKEPNEKIESLSLLLRLNQHINQSLTYMIREEEGVQTPEQTIYQRSGSCRDSACLFMAAAKYLGFAARFVSGYIYPGDANKQLGQSESTHAWAEVFIPGAGWKGFDSTIGIITGAEHIPVAVARLPESVPPISGAFIGISDVTMNVDIQVKALA